ncbi:hypothetical protein TcasGA2_TC002839 [Tribolium castaneum]|uniref:Uncharacterized protein n=1 Tax=Tribolium castaneum TaxID=7070 RepID=D6WI70_TRICA|nr:hypothetical protein TcasGA2_TC002839 [Tribolium castaneum]
MEPEKQVGVRGKVVNAQSRAIIANVLKFMIKEAETQAPVVPLAHYRQRVLLATGVSEKIYRQVSKEMKLIEKGELKGFTSPGRRRRSKSGCDRVKNEDVEEMLEIVLTE